MLTQKGNLSIIIALIVVLLIGTGLYLLSTKSNKSSLETSSSQQSTQQANNLTPPTMISKELFEGLKRPKIEQQDQKLVFTDGGLYGYKMDFTSIPEVTLTNADGPRYPFTAFEFDMYKLREPRKASVARFTFSVPMNNPDNLTLEDFVKQKIGYKEGRTEGGYGGPNITSKIMPTELTNNKGITWDTQLESKVHFSKHYLIEQNGKLIYTTMYSWAEADFQKALVQYNKVVSSLDVTKEPVSEDKDVFYLWSQQKPNDVLALFAPYGDVGESVSTMGSGWQPNTDLEVKIVEATNDTYNIVDGKLRTDDKGHFDGYFTIPERFTNADVPFLRVQVSNPKGQGNSQYVHKAEVIFYFLDNKH